MYGEGSRRPKRLGVGAAWDAGKTFPGRSRHLKKNKDDDGGGCGEHQVGQDLT
ncbi:hypothetical protein L7F22_043024, partial [Adiantum nelumboides]|nr:hypothetical protein [Adiantum nelumboides]